MSSTSEETSILGRFLSFILLSGKAPVALDMLDFTKSHLIYINNTLTLHVTQIGIQQ